MTLLSFALLSSSGLTTSLAALAGPLCLRKEAGWRVKGEMKALHSEEEKRHGKKPVPSLPRPLKQRLTYFSCLNPLGKQWLFR